MLLSMLDGAGATPISLLVVPDYHRRAPVPADRAFVRAMEARLARGDELVLHGLFHVDTAPAPRTLRGWIERRLQTRGEGEFAALQAAEAASRIERGVAMFGTLGWPLHGFVPPAWLMSDAARAALADCAHPFEYMTVRRGIHRLPGWRFERTANLCYSPWNAARRAYSAQAIRHELRRAARVPLLRLSLHPQDARFSVVMRHWERLIVEALATRRLVTKREWVAFTGPAEPASAKPSRAGPAHAHADAALPRAPAAS